MRQYLAVLAFTNILVVAASIHGILPAVAADTACPGYDSLALKNLEKFRHDPKRIDQILSDMNVGDCSFEKSYEFCATELQVKLCVDLVQGRKTADEACLGYDTSALENLKKFRHDPTQIETIISVMSSYGEHCSFEKSYDFCATELKVEICVDLVQLRKETE